MKTFFNSSNNSNQFSISASKKKNYFLIPLYCLLISMSSMSFCMAEKTTDENNFKITWDNCPTASFTVSNNGSATTTPIIFVNQSTNATSYHWDFGDGNVSCDENPTHTYSNAGTYTVTLRAIIGGCEHSYIVIVETIMG